jgi:hypothetical protein
MGVEIEIRGEAREETGVGVQVPIEARSRNRS